MCNLLSYLPHKIPPFHFSTLGNSMKIGCVMQGLELPISKNKSRNGMWYQGNLPSRGELSKKILITSLLTLLFPYKEAQKHRSSLIHLYLLNIRSGIWQWSLRSFLHHHWHYYPIYGPCSFIMEIILHYKSRDCTAQKMKFSIKDFFNKCDHSASSCNGNNELTDSLNQLHIMP